MTLHTLNLANPDVLQRLLRFANPQDSLLLTGDVVYLLPQLNANPAAIVTYYRRPDADQRGLDTRYSPAIPIDDEAWVKLTLTHQRLLTWKQS